MAVNPSNIDEVVREYLAARNLLKELKDAYEAKCQPLKEYKEKRAGMLQEFLTAHKLKNGKSAHGTFYSKTKHTASLEDADAFMEFVIENQEFDLLDRKANITAIRAYIMEHKAMPPGCKISSISNIIVNGTTGGPK